MQMFTLFARPSPSFAANMRIASRRCSDPFFGMTSVRKATRTLWWSSSPGVHMGLLKLADMEAEVSELLGRKFDLNTPGFLSPYFREDVLRQARVVHEQT